MSTDPAAAPRRTHALVQAVLVGGIAVLACLALSWLAPVLTPVVFALGIAYLLNPLATRLARRRVPRPIAAGILLLGFTLVAAGLLAMLIPLLASDVRRFVADLPALFERGAAWARTALGVEVPADWESALGQFGGSLHELLAAGGGPLLRAALAAVTSVLGLLATLLELAIIPVFAFYFLSDWPGIVLALKKLVPPRHRAVVFDVLGEIDVRVSVWLRGQLTVMATLAVLYSVALSIVGIQLAVPVGMLAGLLTVVPYVGALIGLGLAVSMALLGWQGPGPLVGVVVTFVVLNVVEGFVLTPRLVGVKVGLGEAGALFAVLAGGHLFGFVGVMLGVPLAAAAMVLVRRGAVRWEKSDLYLRGASAPEPASEPEKESAAP